MKDSTSLLREAMAWIDQDPDSTTRQELADLIDRVEKGDNDAAADLQSRFGGHLTFGTAGLRAEIGAGPLRMNRVVVSHAAHGLGMFLLKRLSNHTPSVVIGYDARHNSDVFAKDTAEILQAMGIRAILFDQMTPTPVLAFAVRHLEADAGVMVTASHNPPADNGYKVYLGGEDGGSQIVPPTDAAIHDAIMDSHQSAKASELPRSKNFDAVGHDVISAYENATAAVTSGFDAAGRSALRICYTPLHGVGGDVFLRLLDAHGFSAVHVVDAQAAPDPDFPTVSFPNPEEPGALDLAIETASQVTADLIIAHDPDADRLAVALPDPAAATGWSMLSGNELGAILASARAEQVSASGGTGVIGYSLVSSPIARTIAEQHGLTGTETPTGFKWISRLPGLVFGYEEALGYLVNPETVRDKDGISAGLFLASLAAEAQRGGQSLRAVLRDVQQRYGGFASDQISLRFASPAAARELMETVRALGAGAFPGLPIREVRDYLETTGAMPSTDLIQFSLESGARAIVRPSGTEPKLKVYVDVIAGTQEDAETELRALRDSLESSIEKLSGRGHTA